MSEVPLTVTDVPSGGPDKRAWAQSVVTEVLKLLEIPARLELKEAADNGIAVAVHLEKDVPGLPAGKRSSLLDALQFLSNKIVNRPNTERRWISIGVGGFPEPRPAQAPRPAIAPVAEVAHAQPVAAPQAPRSRAAPPPARPVHAGETEERAAQVPPMPEVVALGKMLAQKCVQHGRHYGVVVMPFAERANLIRGAEGVSGLVVKAEGEGRNRRVVFTPDKPTPMPKRAFMQDDDDEYEE
jgi:predicted RNA-binding protein Jag